MAASGNPHAAGEPELSPALARFSAAIDAMNQWIGLVVGASVDIAGTIDLDGVITATEIRLL